VSQDHAELDKIINDHFSFEATDDVEGVMNSLASDIEHEVVPSPTGVSRDKSKIRSYYEMLFANVRAKA
jgi:hypothetical protein